MTSTRERYAWLDQAACLPYPDWDEWGDWAELVKICAGCPVRKSCLETALRLGTGGVRGGTTARQRRAMGSHGPGDLIGWVRMVDGRPDRPLFTGLHDWWVRNGSNEHLPSINPMQTDHRNPTERIA